MQVEIEHESPSYRSLRGIIVEMENDSFLFLTDFGEVVRIYDEKLLNYTVVNFPRVVSEVMQELRNEHESIYQLEEEIKKRKQNIKELNDKLSDANFLSKFNIHGAKNRIEHSLSESMQSFYMKDTYFYLDFDSNENEEIQLLITASNKLDYPQFDESRDVEKILRFHAPDIGEWLIKAFPSSKSIKVESESVSHESESIYYAKRRYLLLFDVTKENFIEFRDKLIKGIEFLKR